MCFVAPVELVNFFESSQEMFCIVDTEGGFQKFNKSFQNALGWHETELVQKSIFDLVLQEDEADLRDFISTADRFKAETHLGTADGKKVVLLFGSRIGNSPFCYLSVRDITDQKVLEDTLKFSTNRYSLISKATSDAIYDWDIVTDKLFWGEGFNKIFGFDESNHSIKEWESKVHPEDKAEIARSLRELIADPDRNCWNAEYRYQRKDGSFAYVVEDGYVVRNGLGEAIRMVGAVHDITSAKLNEIRILQQNKALKDIAMMNSHEMRKPLANILGILETLRNSNSDNLNELLEMLYQSGRELDDITRKIAGKTIS